MNPLLVGIAWLVAGLTRWANLIAGVALLLIVAVTVLSAASRFIIGVPIPDAEALCEMLLVAAVLLPLAGAQKKQEHVAVTLFTDKLAPKNIDRLRRFGCLIGVGAFAVLAYALALGAWKAWVTNDAYLGVNLIATWPSRLVAALAVAILVLRLAYDMLKNRGETCKP